jgi:hypothetical protein
MSTCELPDPGSSLYLANGVTVASYQNSRVIAAIALLVRLRHTILQKLKKNSDINKLLGWGSGRMSTNEKLKAALISSAVAPENTTSNDVSNEISTKQRGK